MTLSFVDSSSTVHPQALLDNRPLAQLVEQQTLNLTVQGSSPWRPTIHLQLDDRRLHHALIDMSAVHARFPFEKKESPGGDSRKSGEGCLAETEFDGGNRRASNLQVTKQLRCTQRPGASLCIKSVRCGNAVLVAVRELARERFEDCGHGVHRERRVDLFSIATSQNAPLAQPGQSRRLLPFRSTVQIASWRATFSTP